MSLEQLRIWLYAYANGLWLCRFDEDLGNPFRAVDHHRMTTRLDGNDPRPCIGFEMGVLAVKYSTGRIDINTFGNSLFTPG